MKNKIYLKRFILISIIIFLTFLVILISIKIKESHDYTILYNNKIDAIVSKVHEKYPNITKNEIIEILNNRDNQSSFLKEYGIDLSKDYILLESKFVYQKYFIIIIIVYSFMFIIIMFVFLRYNKKKDTEIKCITKYIEEINKRNYSYDLDGITEDELSILKNEICKVTTHLKETTETLENDKRNLKKSLEDISHQIKTPLTSITILLDNLIDGDIPIEKQEEFLHDIKKETVNINNLVINILKLSKFDANAIVFKKKEVYLNDLIEKAIYNVSILSDVKNVPIITKVNKKIKLYCDMMWEVEALTNILKNAIEHSNENSSVIIECIENSVYTELTIINNGDIICKEDLPHIFERFYQSKNSSKNNFGIGLSLANEIIKRDNGKITVESNNDTKCIIKYYKW